LRRRGKRGKGTMAKKYLRCVCGHAQNKHSFNDGGWDTDGACIVKGCDCDYWRWDKKQREGD